MAEALAPEDLRRMQVISVGMLAGTIFLLGASLYMYLTAEREPGLPIVSYVVAAVAVLSPVVAIGIDRMLAARAPTAGDTKARLRRHIASYGLLEGAAFMCAGMLFVSSDPLLLAAALVPVGTMVLRFPRSS